MALDYLLYDNRTAGDAGPDWGIKLGTGPLAGDARVRQLFAEYCERSFDTSRDPLKDFDAALGGVPLPEDGYLLCVTLETRDRHDRCSYGIVGIHCPGRAELRGLLGSADPIATARRVCESSSPTTYLEPVGRSLFTSAQPVAEPRLQVHPSGTRFAAFERVRSPAAAAAILWRASSGSGALPSILGIAPWRSSQALARARDDVAFYQGLPARLPAAEVVEEPREPVLDRGPAVPVRAGASPQERIAAIVLAGAFAVLAAFVIRGVTAPRPTAASLPAVPASGLSAVPLAAPDERRAPAKPPPVPPRGASSGAVPRDLLGRTEVLVTELAALDPAELERSRVLAIVERVEVRPEHEPNRDRLMSLLTGGLPVFRHAVLEEVNLGYYFLPENRRRIDEPQRQAKVREHLARLTPPLADCRLLRSAFAALLREPDSVPAAWCGVVERFAEIQPEPRLRQPK